MLKKGARTRRRTRAGGTPLNQRPALAEPAHRRQRNPGPQRRVLQRERTDADAPKLQTPPSRSTRTHARTHSRTHARTAPLHNTQRCTHASARTRRHAYALIFI